MAEPDVQRVEGDAEDARGGEEEDGAGEFGAWDVLRKFEVCWWEGDGLIRQIAQKE